MKYKVGDILQQTPSSPCYTVMITEVSSNSYEIVFLQCDIVKAHHVNLIEDSSSYTYICSINDLDLK
jgi:hypothetical protein